MSAQGATTDLLEACPAEKPRGRDARDTEVDVIRFLVLMLIVYITSSIHTTPKIFDSFVVFVFPCLCFLGGYTFTPHSNSIKKYLLDKIISFLIPTYIFLYLFWASVFLWREVQPYHTLNLPESMFFLDNIPYLSYVRTLLSFIASDLFCLTTLGLIMAFYMLGLEENCCSLCMNTPILYPFSRLFCGSYIPLHASFFGLGATYSRVEKSWKYLIVCVLIWIGFSVWHYMKEEPLDVRIYMTPPRGIYISYSLSMTLLLMNLLPFLNSLAELCHIMESIHFVGSHSLWFFLYLIMFIPITRFDIPVFLLCFSLQIVYAADTAKYIWISLSISLFAHTTARTQKIFDNNNKNRMNGPSDDGHLRLHTGKTSLPLFSPLFLEL
eukprot:gene12998-8844_t